MTDDIELLEMIIQFLWEYNTDPNFGVSQVVEVIENSEWLREIKEKAWIRGLYDGLRNGHEDDNPYTI